MLARRVTIAFVLVLLLSTASGSASAETCFGLLDTDPAVCAGNGVCVGPDLCACTTGYFGFECASTTCFGVANTDPAVCSSAGVCVGPDLCACAVGYTGSNCETQTSSVPALSTWGALCLGLSIPLGAAIALVRIGRRSTG